MFRVQSPHHWIAAVLMVAFSFAGCSEDDSKTTTGAPAASSASATPASASPSASASGAPLPSDDPAIPGVGGFGGAQDTRPTVSGKAPPEPPPKSAPEPKTAKPTPPSIPASPIPAPQVDPEPPPPTPVASVEPAKAGSADEVAAKVDKVYDPIKRFRARFEQKFVAKVAATSKNSSGVVYVERPGKLSLSYHQPNKNRVVADGETVKIYQHEDKQMFLRPVKNTDYPGAFAFIMGKGLRPNFTFTFHKTAQWEGGPVIVGKPRVPNPGYKAVLFYIDEELLKKGDPGCVRRVLVVDAQGNKNRFDFIHIELPTSIPAKEFLFEPPAGTNIIK
jgi:outer membrane lipoprotein-sorting protein